MYTSTLSYPINYYVIPGIKAPDLSQSEKRDIINEVIIELFELDVYEFYNGPKNYINTMARHIAWALTGKFTNLSLAQIGLPFKKDHSTILNATTHNPSYTNSIYSKIEFDKELREMYEKCKQKVEQQLGKSPKE